MSIHRPGLIRSTSYRNNLALICRLRVFFVFFELNLVILKEVYLVLISRLFLFFLGCIIYWHLTGNFTQQNPSPMTGFSGFVLVSFWYFLKDFSILKQAGQQHYVMSCVFAQMKGFTKSSIKLQSWQPENQFL